MSRKALRPSRPRSQGMGDEGSSRSKNGNQNRASRRKARPQIILFTENVRGLTERAALVCTQDRENKIITLINNYNAFLDRAE